MGSRIWPSSRNCGRSSRSPPPAFFKPHRDNATDHNCHNGGPRSTAAARNEMHKETYQKAHRGDRDNPESPPKHAVHGRPLGKRRPVLLRRSMPTTGWPYRGWLVGAMPNKPTPSCRTLPIGVAGRSATGNRLDFFQRDRIVRAHEPGISGHVDGQDRC